jgi:tetratricopeptide (TPR) repeat protein
MKKQLTPSIKNPAPHQSELNSLLEHYQNGRYEDAEKLALIFTDKFRTHPFGWKVLGAVLNQTGRISEGLIACQKSVELAPENAEAHYNLGVTLKELGRLEEAEESYRQAISLKLGYFEAHSNLGNTLKELGRLEEAEESYRQAIALKPDFALAHYNLGNTLHKLGRLELAVASYKQAISLKLGYFEAHSSLGNTLKDLGRLELAVASYKQAIALKPDFALTHYNLGVTLKELDRLEEAEESYRQAIALKPDFALALMNRGQLLFDKGEFEIALRDFDLCDTKNSRACALESLYALGRIEDIYKRIETQSEVDDENLGIAAIAAFLAEREKKDTAHNFCKNPLEFIHFSNISSHLEDSNLFITEVIEELHNVKTIWEPRNLATLKGFQSNINLFRNPLEKMSCLKSIIIDELDSYYSKFKNKSCSYIQKWPSEKRLLGWHVILKQHGNQKVHMHPSGWLSGVIYLKVVPTLGKDEGAIEFGLSGERYSHVDSPKVMYQPKLGDIVFFPSSLHHRTVPFKTDTDRIIISFDLKPKAAKH